VKYVQVGLGYRWQAFKRVLNDMEGFEPVAMVLRRPLNAGVPVYTDLDECLGRAKADMVISFTPPTVTPQVIATCAAHQMPLLAETPPAMTMAELAALEQASSSGLIQIAEQYAMMPGHAARLAAVARGLIGEVSQVQISSTQTYHAMALIRAYLGIGVTKTAVVRAHRFSGPLVDPLTRAGWTGQTAAKQAGTVLASVDFGEGLSGVYDFTDNQTRNLLRTRRLLVRGSHGEISGDQVVRLAGHNLITTTYLNRRQTGHDLDLNGYCTYQITFGDEVVWSNPWPQMRWNDDELAVAELMTRMAAWVRGEAEPPYPLADAVWDTKLGLAIEQAVDQDQPVRV
jgi:predicted dehydrogenase